MPEAKKIPFLKLFSAWRPESDLLPLVEGWLVTGAVIDKGTRRISARVECPRLPADALKARDGETLRQLLKDGREKKATAGGS